MYEIETQELRPILGRGSMKPPQPVEDNGYQEREMVNEVERSVCQVQQYLYDKVPRRKIGQFSERLANLLLKEYQMRSMYSDCHGRAIGELELSIKPKRLGGQIDSMIENAVKSLGISATEILRYLPLEPFLADLEIKMAPGKVIYRDTLNGEFQVVSTNVEGWERSAAMAKLRIKNHADRVAFHFVDDEDIDFTVDSFSKTRFGSVKNKTDRVGKTIEIHDGTSKGAVLHL